MNAAPLRLLGCVLGLIGMWTPIQARSAGFDPLSTQKSVAASPIKDMIAPDEARRLCRFEPPLAPVGLLEAVDRALCQNPQTREAWAEVQAQAAALGAARSAYLPTLSVAVAEDATDTQIQGAPVPDAHVSSTQYDGNLSMGWVLLDFGPRRAAVDRARQLLAAANANEDSKLQSVLLDAARADYNAVAALSALDAALTAENAAQQNFQAAEAKHAAGVGALADQLQAQTAFAQATLNRVRADGAYRNAAGQLAVVMGLEANARFTLARNDSPRPDTAFVESVDALIEQARHSRPSLIAAQARLQAARADVAALKGGRWPVLSLNGSLDRNDPSGQYSADATIDQRRIGLQLSMPLFEGFGRLYRIRQAQAVADARQADFDQAQLQTSFDVWQSYQSLRTQTESLRATEELLQSAQQSFDEAQGRYKAGVGSIIELLGAQSAYANAQYQGIVAQSDWRIARLELAANLGRLGVWTLAPARPLAKAEN